MSSPAVKIFCFRFSESCDWIPPSRAHQEGRTRRHERGARDAMDVLVSRDERRRHGRRSRVVLTPRRWCQACEMMISRVTGARKPGPRGERAISRNTIAQGRPVDWLNLWCLPPAFLLLGHGCGQPPGFPCALRSRRDTLDGSLGRDRACRECDVVSHRLLDVAMTGDTRRGWRRWPSSHASDLANSIRPRARTRSLFRSDPKGVARARRKAVAAAWRYSSERRKNTRLPMTRLFRL
jgi:hypothetical protein